MRLIDGYLNDEPIHHRRPNVWPLLQLAYRRNRTVFNLAAAFLVVSVLGVVICLVRVTPLNTELEQKIAELLVNDLYDADESGEFNDKFDALREFPVLPEVKKSDKLPPVEAIDEDTRITV